MEERSGLSACALGIGIRVWNDEEKKAIFYFHLNEYGQDIDMSVYGFSIKDRFWLGEEDPVWFETPISVELVSPIEQSSVSLYS